MKRNKPKLDVLRKRDIVKKLWYLHSHACREEEDMVACRQLINELQSR